MILSNSLSIVEVVVVEVVGRHSQNTKRMAWNVYLSSYPNLPLGRDDGVYRAVPSNVECPHPVSFQCDRIVEARGRGNNRFIAFSDHDNNVVYASEGIFYPETPLVVKHMVSKSLDNTSSRPTSIKDCHQFWDSRIHRFPTSKVGLYAMPNTPRLCCPKSAEEEPVVYLGMVAKGMPPYPMHRVSQGGDDYVLHVDAYKYIFLEVMLNFIRKPSTVKQSKEPRGVKGRSEPSSSSVTLLEKMKRSLSTSAVSENEQVHHKRHESGTDGDCV